MTPTPNPELISNGNNKSEEVAVENCSNPDHGITKEFLEKALKEEALMNGTAVPRILSYKVEEGSQPGDNYLSLIYSVDLELENSPKRKRHLVIKCYPNHFGRQQFSNKNNIFFKEMEIYKKWIPELRKFQANAAGVGENMTVPLPYAPFVYGECIDFQTTEGKCRASTQLKSLDNFIIMEDIRKTSGYRMTDRRGTLDLDHMRLVVTALGRVHSLSWAYKQLVEAQVTSKFPCLNPVFQEEELAVWTSILLPSLEQAQAIYDAEFGEGNPLSKGVERFKCKTLHETALKVFLAESSGTTLGEFLRVNPVPERFGKDSENPVDWKVIVHGDCWSNNMLFKYDEATKKPVAITLVDLQLAQEACVVNDLQYVTYVCTDRALRHAHLDELLQLYHDTFNGVCSLFGVQTLPGFNLETLKYRFHRAKPLGYFMANMGLPIVLKEKVRNLEEMEEGKDVFDALRDISSTNSDNEVLKKRLTEVAEDMENDGVF